MAYTVTIDQKGVINQEKIVYITIQNTTTKIVFCNIGASIVSLETKDREGVFTDIVLGFDCYQDYATNIDNYMGSVVGRYANRIKDGKFSIDDKSYQLTLNNKRNHLHGGLTPINTRVWSYVVGEQGLSCLLHSKDLEGGYPGNVDLKVTYLLDGDSLLVSYDGLSDQDTILNLTNHTYFNLDGHDYGSLEHHLLQLLASSYIPIDEFSIPLGDIEDVIHSPFDFQNEKYILQDINQEHIQLKRGNGYDHCFVLKTGASACLYSEHSGRFVAISTTKPGLQVYTANYMNCSGKHATRYGPRNAVALETQYFPDSVHHSNFPSCICKKNVPYHHETKYTFGIRE